MSQTFYRGLCLFCFLAATVAFLAELNGQRIAGGIAHLDKAVHFAIFALLAALLWKGFRLKPTTALLILGSYGGGIELTQHFFTRRHGDWLDFLADIAGVASFYLIRAIWHTLRPRRQR